MIAYQIVTYPVGTRVLHVTSNKPATVIKRCEYDAGACAIMVDGASIHLDTRDCFLALAE